MTETVEDQLIIMKPHLIKINKYRNSMEVKQGVLRSVDGKLELSMMKGKISHHTVVLYPDTKGDLGLSSFKKVDRKTADNSASYASMNQEWRTMFSTQDSVQVLLILLFTQFFHLFSFEEIRV